MKLFILTLFFTTSVFAALVSQEKLMNTAYSRGLSSDQTATMSHGAIFLELSDATSVSKTFTASSADDTLAISAHGFFEGLVGTVSSAGGTLAGGLSGATNYYVIPVTSGTIKLATSLLNAQAGTAINLSTDGTGTQKFIPLGLAGAYAIPQCSPDNSLWINEGVSTTVVASNTTNVKYSITDNNCKFRRTYINLTSGQVATSQTTSYR